MARVRAMRAKNSVSGAAAGLQNVIDSAEDMLENVKDQKGDAIDRMRKKLAESVAEARQRLANLEVPESVSVAYDNTLGFVRDDPWRAVAIGALAILAVTVLIRATADD
jgi:ElaB/YqjD/DUF883 family membrane-anchored ribosome-binding protein